MRSIVWTCFLCLLVLGLEAKPKKAVGKSKASKFTDKTPKDAFKGPNKFPDRLKYDMDVEGHGTVELNLIWEPMLSVTKNTPGKSKGVGQPQVGFYTDESGHGSFACEIPANGEPSCEISGLVTFNDEGCYIAPGGTEAECGGPVEGQIDEVKIPDDVEPPSNVTSRRKRGTLPTGSFMVVEGVFAMDGAFMQRFYDRNPSDDAAAQAEAERFAVLLSNEMNVFLSTIDAVSGGNLDIYSYPSEIIYPPKNDDFQWAKDHSDGFNLYATNSMQADLRDWANARRGSNDHVHVFTGLDLNSGGSGVIGFAYRGVTCTTSQYRHSINEYIYYNLGWVASHEVGHSLGAPHDGSGCPAGQNVMSSYLYIPDASTVDSFHYFSTCSVNSISSHLSGRGCLGTGGFTSTQFETAFCEGLLGEGEFGLDYQCHVRTGWSGSTACGSVSNDAGCYSNGFIRCSRQSDSPGTCSGPYLTFVWNGTPCGSGKMCYKGRCMTEFDVCDGAAPPSTPAPPPTTPSAGCDCCQYVNRGRCCSINKKQGNVCACC